MSGLVLGMVIGIALATLFITTLEAMQRQWKWIEALIKWIQKRLPE